MKSIKEILAVIGILLALGGSMFAATQYFATDSALCEAKTYAQYVEQRLDLKILYDLINQTRQRMWQLEDRNGGPDVTRWFNQNDKEEYRQLQVQLEELRQKYQIMIEKGVK